MSSISVRVRSNLGISGWGSASQARRPSSVTRGSLAIVSKGGAASLPAVLGATMWQEVHHYPECTWRIGPWYVPVMILIGEKDDWTPARLCERRRAASVTVKVYEGAHHSFDSDSPLTFLRDVKNLHSSTGRGATVGSNRTATKSAKRDIEAFSNRYMGKAAGS